MIIKIIKNVSGSTFASAKGVSARLLAVDATAPKICSADGILLGWVSRFKRNRRIRIPVTEVEAN